MNTEWLYVRLSLNWVWITGIGLIVQRFIFSQPLGAQANKSLQLSEFQFPYLWNNGFFLRPLPMFVGQ